MDRRERGIACGARSISSKPTTLTSGGTCRRRSRMARMAPMAIASLMARTAVGRRPASQAPPSAARPPSMLAGPTTTRSAGISRPDRRERLAIAAQPAHRHALGVQRSDRRRRLDADDQDVAMAQADEMLGRRAGAADVVDLDGAVLRQGVESTSTIGSPARRIYSTSGWSSDSPIATTPSTVARPMARANEPRSGEMKWRAYPAPRLPPRRPR